jgi:hypothetical protein
VALGIGLHYHYSPHDQILDVLTATGSSPLLHVVLDDYVAQDPRTLVRLLDKSAQTKALILSNNSTHNLAVTFESAMLKAIAESAFSLALHGLHLEKEDFSRFDGFFCADFSLKRLRIRKMVNPDPVKNLYLGVLKTHHEKYIRTTACSLHKLLAVLADRTLRELVTSEYGYHFQSPAYDLMNVSSKLALLSRIIDARFIPAERIRRNTGSHALLKA